MIADLKPYPATRDSGLEWLGEVPQHWEVRRGKNIFRCIDVRSEAGEEELLTVSSERGVVPRRSANVTMFKAESYIGHKLCWPGDLVINSLWAWARGLGVSRYHGIISSAYGVYRPKETVDAKFIHELVRSTPFHWELRVRSKGVWTSRLQLTDTSFLDAPFLLPPLPEQASIVRFLDHVDRRVWRYVQAQQKLIELLEEQKQAIIHRAVTRGLDTDVPLKPSGVEWLGDIPERWQVVRAKFAFDCVDVRSSTGEEELLTVSSSDGVVPRAGRNITMFKAASYVGHKLCWPEDLVINSLWAWANGLGFSDRHGIISSAYGVYRLRKRYAGLWRYLDLALRSRAYQWQFQVRSKGIWKSRLQLTDWSFLDMPLVLPPEPGANAICEFVQKNTDNLSRAISSARRDIELVRDYRTRLIADVVTGKLDVREAAANLPDEADEPEPLDEVDDLIDESDAIPEEAEL